MRTLAASFMLGIAVPLHAQTPARPTYAPAVERITQLAQHLADAMNAGDDKAAEARREAFVTGVDEMLAAQEVLTTSDYNRSATIAMNVRCLEVCQKIARFTISKLEQPGQLREFLGVANMMLAERCKTDAEMRALATEAVAALEIWCEAKPGSVGPGYLLQAYGSLGEWQKALAWDDRLRQRKSRLAAPPMGRAVFSLGAGQWEAAVALLRSKDVTDAQDAGTLDVLVSRGLALGGKLDESIASARANVERKASDTAVAALADALAFAGKHDEALAVLKKHPAKDKDDDARIQAGLTKSRAVLAYLIGLRGKRPADLRQQLGKLLDVNFVVMGLKEGDALAKAMAGSPWALGSTVRKVPTGPAGWANDVLFAVCVRDVVKYVQPDAEQALLAVLIDDATKQLLTGADAWAIANRDARSHLVIDDHPGALVVRQMLDKL